MEQIAKWAVCMPGLLGLGFPLLIKLDHTLFGAGMISVRGAIAIELLYVLVCLAFVLFTVIHVVRAMIARRPAALFLGLTSLMIWLAFMGIGIELGAAIVYAA